MGGRVCISGGQAVIYRKCWVRGEALGVNSLGMGPGGSGGYMAN